MVYICKQDICLIIKLVGFFFFNEAIFIMSQIYVLFYFVIQSGYLSIGMIIFFFYVNKNVLEG